MTEPNRRAVRPHGFTLTELLVVIIIIVVLVSILVPTVSKVLASAREAKTKAFMTVLEGAIEAYHLDFRSYPGPFPNNMIDNASATATGTGTAAIAPSFNGFGLISPVPAGYDTTTVDVKKITMSENLTLGLLGGLRVDTNSKLLYDPSQVGQGPMELGVGLAKRHNAYLTVDLNSATSFKKGANGTSGRFSDELATADDTVIPEFVDTFTNPLPILYLRAKVGAAADKTAALSNKNNAVVTYDSTETDPSVAGTRVGQYDLHQIIGYTGTAIGVGKDLPEVCTDGTGTMINWKNQQAYHGLAKSMNNTTTPTVMSVNQVNQTNSEQYYYPYDAYPYFRNASASSTGADKKYGNMDDLEVPKQKDQYILISAGKDRVYGTDDDITNFGTVGP